MINQEELIAKAERVKGKIDHIYIHHTAGTYKMNDLEKSHYHICIEGDGSVKINSELDELKSHTWRRNSGAIGIAICCAAGAICYRDENIAWGKYPPKQIQITETAKVVAILAKTLEMPIDRLHVLTHDEVAVIDNYDIKSSDPDCRWDLRWLDDPGTGERHKRGGDVIRGLAIWMIKQGVV